MSERHIELWGRSFGSREEFDPDGVPTGIAVIEVMRFHCALKDGRKKEDQAKVVAHKLRLQWNRRGYATSQEYCIATKIEKIYKTYLKLDQKGDRYRTEAWKQSTVTPFKDKIQQPFIVASHVGEARYLKKNREPEDAQKVKN